MNFGSKTSFKTLILVSQILLASVFFLSQPVFAQQQYQYPTLSVNPSNVAMYTPTATINVALSSVTGLNALHFVFSFNDQGSTFLSVSNGDIALGNLFTGVTPTLSTSLYYLNSTGKSYVNAVIEMPGNTGVSSTTTKNVLAITLHLLPTVIGGMQSGLNLEEADALFTSGQYIDEAGGLTLQSGTLTVGYLTTTMTATSITTTAGTSTMLTSTLQDSVGNPLAGMNVDYYIGSQKVGTGITDASGVSSLAYTPTAAGSYTITASYLGNQTGGKFASSSATATLTVNPQSQPPTTKPTSLTLNVPQSLTSGVSTTISATLTQGSNPLPNENIIFASTPTGGSMSSIGYATTNNNGVATVSYAFSAAGSYTVQAQFLGDTNNQPSNITTSVNVASPQNSGTGTSTILTTILTLSVPSSGKVNVQVVISSTLKDSSQQPIAGVTIEYSATVNGIKQPIGSAQTDANGFSSIPFVPVEAQTYQVDANFGGSSSYSSSSDSKSLTVNALMGNKTDTTITLALSTNSVNTQTFVTISATLKDQNGNPLAQEKMVYQYSSDGTTWNNITTVTTGSDGVAQSNYKPAQTGALTIRALFDGDTNYHSSASNEETLSVSDASGNFTIPWIWITIISAVAIIVVALSIAIAKFRTGNHSANKEK